MLEPLIPLVPFAFGSLGLGIAFVQSRQRLRAWQKAAVQCGLEVDKATVWRTRLTAHKGPIEVKIERHGPKGQSTRIIVTAPWPPDFHVVSIHREPLLRWGPEIEVGDPTFDSTFFIEGPARQILALLDEETRRLLLEANSGGRLEIANGTLRANYMSSANVPSVLRRLVDIAQRISRPMDVLQRLTDNARREPEPGVRLSNLLLLVRELPGNPWTVEALRNACSDPSPAIRLRAASELGAEGRDTLVALAEGLEDDASSAQAVAQLGRELPAERTQSILLDALRRRSIQTARACLEALGTEKNAAAVDTLTRVLELEKGELASVAARALGTTGNPAAEPPLIEALQRDPADLRVAAASALGRLGSAAAVLPLKEVSERSWLDLDLRRAARQAVAEIQSRLSGASPGQLSIAGTDAGQLSLAQNETGRLSLAQEAGHLTLAQGEAAAPEQPPRKTPEGPGGRRV
jgi:hypothetical protein